MMLMDLHVHSTFSDGRMAVPDVIDYFGQRGFGAIAITDHLCERRSFLGRAAGYIDQTITPATFPLYRAILESEARRAWRRYRMVVIPGVEFTRNRVSNWHSAHFLALGLDRYLPADGPLDTLARKARYAGALTVAAHPVHTRKREKQTYYLWRHRELFRDLFDAWEVASGPHLFHEVLESGLPLVANSDFHTPSDMNSWKTVTDARRDRTSILDAVRNQDIDFTYYEEDVSDGIRRYINVDDLGRIHRSGDIRHYIEPEALRA